MVLNTKPVNLGSVNIRDIIDKKRPETTQAASRKDF